MERATPYKGNIEDSFAETNTIASSDNWGVSYNEFYEDASREDSGADSNGACENLSVYIDGNELNEERGSTLKPVSPKPCRKKKSKSDSSTRSPSSQRKCFSVSKKDICKRARNSGKSYVKLKGKETGSFVEEKEIGGNCLCPNKCYEKVGEETIEKIFRDFWALGDYNFQNAYLFGLINLFGVKRRYTKNEKSRRNFTITYSVKKKGESVNVCKKAFLNIHGLQKNRGRINNLANKMKCGESVPPPDQRGRHSNRPNAYSEEAILHVKNHLAQCPKVERKKTSSKCWKYMEYSTKRCYDLYVAVYCKEHNLLPVSLDKYRRIFWEEGYRNSQSSRRAQGNVIPSNVTIRKLSY